MSTKIEAPPKIGENYSLPHIVNPGITLKNEQEIQRKCAQALFLTRISKKALAAFKKKNFIKFDALVGENACQIRACKINDLAVKYLCDSSFVKEIDNKIDQLKKVIREMEEIRPSNFVQKDKKTPIPMDTFLQGNGFYVDLNNDLKFIVESYFLTVTKKENIVNCEEPWVITDTTEYSELDRLAKKWGSQLEQNPKWSAVVSSIKKNLADMSVQYVKSEGNFLEKTPENDLDVKIVNGFTQEHQKLKCTPCFFNFDILVKRILAKEQKILVKIDRWGISENKSWAEESFKLIYEASADKTHFVPAENQECSGPVIVFEGISIVEHNDMESLDEYKKRFFAIPIGDIILANVAQHEQYPHASNKEFEALLLSQIDDAAKARFEHYREKAEEWKCSLDNRDLALVTHIYCDFNKAVKQ